MTKDDFRSDAITASRLIVQNLNRHLKTKKVSMSELRDAATTLRNAIAARQVIDPRPHDVAEPEVQAATDTEELIRRMRRFA